MAILGFEIAIHRSLTEQILLGGVPRGPAILNGTFMAAMGLGLHSFFAIPLFFFSLPSKGEREEGCVLLFQYPNIGNPRLLSPVQVFFVGFIEGYFQLAIFNPLFGKWKFFELFQTFVVFRWF